VRGWIDFAHWRALDANLDDLVDAQGGAERHQKHAAPKRRLLSAVFVQCTACCLTLALVTDMGWFPRWIAAGGVL